MTPSANAPSYWRAHLKLLAVLLSLWFICSFVLGILMVDVLNQLHLSGYPLGFWFAQQGAIYSFIAIIFIYARQVDLLDKKFHFEEDNQ